MQNPAEFELDDEAIAILHGVVQGQTGDFAGAAKKLGITPQELAEGVIRYVLSPDYGDDGLEVMIALGLQRDHVLSVARQLETVGSDLSLIQRVSERIGTNRTDPDSGQQDKSLDHTSERKATIKPFGVHQRRRTALVSSLIAPAIIPGATAEPITIGLTAIDDTIRALADTGESITCKDVGRVFDTAIEHGAPIWNSGSQLGCAQIYLRAASAILGWAQTYSVSSAAKAVLQALQQVVDQFPLATMENANRLGWTLRSIFDRFHAARGMEAVDELIREIQLAGGAVNVDLICLVLKVAILHGNLLYKSDSLDIFAVLLWYTARQILVLLSKFEQVGNSLSLGLRRVRRELGPIVGRQLAVTEENAKPLAWELYEAFQNILRVERIESVPERRYDVFISYRRSDDSETARVIHSILDLRGLKTFFDMEVLSSGAFGPHLLRAIEDAPNFLVILTPGCLERRSQGSDWFHLEIAHAIKTHRKIIPILKDGFSFERVSNLPPDIHDLLRFQTVACTSESLDTAIEHIVEYMRATGQ